jgi:hypothetical protein
MPEPEMPREPSCDARAKDHTPPLDGFLVLAVPPPRFNLGRMVITSNAQAVLTPDEAHQALWRHSRGDWGNVCPEDALTNERGVRDQGMILSSYESVQGATFWVITDPGHEVTTVLLPEDY